MKLVEAEAEDPVEVAPEAPVVTPPRPPHRRVSVSLLFTLTVLTGTVVAIYMTFPARDRALLGEAFDRYRDPAPTWDLTTPSPAELRAWTIGVVGPGAPLPALDDGTVSIVGARSVEVQHNRTAVIRFQVRGEPVTYLLQHTRGIAPPRSDRQDGDLKATSWSRGSFAMAVIGPARSEGWPPLFAKL